MGPPCSGWLPPWWNPGADLLRCQLGAGRGDSEADRDLFVDEPKVPRVNIRGTFAGQAGQRPAPPGGSAMTPGRPAAPSARQVPRQRLGHVVGASCQSRSLRSSRGPAAPTSSIGFRPSSGRSSSSPTPLSCSAMSPPFQVFTAMASYMEVRRLPSSLYPPSAHATMDGAKPSRKSLAMSALRPRTPTFSHALSR